MTQRPTTLRLFAEHCPAAVQHYEDGTPYDRSIFAVGTAAHDVLCALATGGMPAVAPTVEALLAVGRGGIDAEPPLPPDAVFEGRDLALRWYEREGCSLGGPSARYEVGLALLPDGTPTRYDDDTALVRARLDVCDVIEYDDEEAAGTGIEVRDYKSAWTTSATLLDGIQLRAQAVLAVRSADRLGFPRPDFVRRTVVNLRTLAVYSDDLWLDEDGEAVLDSWWQDVRVAALAADARPRVASPSSRCLGCGYVARCQPAQDFLADDRVDACARYAVSVALTAELQTAAREATAEWPVRVGDAVIGTVAKLVREPLPDAGLRLWARWREGHPDEAVEPLARGLLAAMGLGVSQIESAAKRIFADRKQKPEREAFVASLLGEKITQRFGIWPDNGEKP
jgi:hypothetical protein